MEKLTDSEVKDAKTYEIGYLLTPFLTAEKADEAVEAMYKTLIDDLGGLSVFKTSPKMRPLAYPVSKFISNKKSTVSEAYFGAVKFQISPEKIRTIKELLEKDNNVVRFLIVNIPKNSERIIIPTGVMSKRIVSDVPSSGEEVVIKGEEMTNEEIDKEIEGLLDTPEA